MRRSAIVTFLAGSLAACGAPSQIRRTTHAELRPLLDLGRRVNQSVLMREAPGLGLTSGSEAKIFRVERGHDDGVPSLIQFDITTSPVLAADEVAAFAAAWLADNAVDLGFAADELTPSERFATWLSDNVYTLSYDRSYAGLPVRDAYVQVNFAVDGDGGFRLREVLNRSHGGIRLENPEATAASLDELAEALQGAALTPLAAREVVYPVEDDTLDVRMLRATEVRVFDEDEGVEATLTFANGSYEPLEAYRHRYAARVGVEAVVHGRSYQEPARVSLPLPLATPGGSTTPTDADGGYEATLTEGAQVSLTLSSSRVVAIATGSNQPYTVTGTYDADKQRVVVDPQGDALVGLNTYMSIQRINGFTRRHLRDSEAAILRRNIRVNTNVEGSCNAFYDGTAISLFAAGDGCPNMALINDVPYHEWGHALDDSVGRTAGITDGAFSEGIGDILSAYYTGSSTMAPGFIQGSADGIRELDNTLKFPDNTGEVHQEGLTIGGAFWDLRKSLIERHGPTRGAFMAERFFMRHLLVTDSYRESYQSVMTLDDDDANPMTPSPNRCLITSAFAKHGLATEEPNCQDAPAASAAIRTEPAIAVSILTSATGSMLAAAGPEATRKMYACVGTETECVTAKREDIVFELDGTKGAKVLFVSKQALAMTEQQSMTVFAVDGAGSVLGKRTFLVHTK